MRNHQSPTAVSFVKLGFRNMIHPDGRVFPLVQGGADDLDPEAQAALDAERDTVFELPEDLTAEVVTDEQLATLLDEAVTAFDSIYDEGVTTPEAQAAISALADAVDAVRTEQDRRTTLAAQAQADADAARARVHGPEGAATDEDGTDAGAEDGTVVDAADDTDGGDGGGAAAPAEPESVTAAAVTRRGRIRVPLGAVARRTGTQPAAEDRATGTLVITASSDVPGIDTGAQLDRRGLADAMHKRVKNLRNGSSFVTAASIERPGLTFITASMSTEEIGAVMDALVNERLSGGITSLLASNGWCAPSAILWDFFNIAASDGLLDVPTLGIDRAGITWPVSPSIADALSVPWLWTEAMDEEAGNNPHEDPDDDVTKPLLDVPCPTWGEARLRAHGLRLKAGNISDRAFPENSANYLALVMAAHEHLMSYRNIASIVAGSSAVAVPTGGTATTGATPQILNAVELQIIDYRSKFRMNEGAVLELVFPTWVRGVIRADLAQRGGVDMLGVTDAQIIEWFAIRSARVQFVQDWLPLQTGTGEVGGGDGFAEAYPATVKFLLYAAGTWVRGLGGTIDLTVGKDSTLNDTNDHTLAGTEELDLMAKRGHESRVVTVPLSITGMTYTRSTYPTA